MNVDKEFFLIGLVIMSVSLSVFIMPFFIIDEWLNPYENAIILFSLSAFFIGVAFIITCFRLPQPKFSSERMNQ